MCDSNTPWVDGYVTISAARSAVCSWALALRSSKSTLPSLSHATTTTRMPAITALAALVPCADEGMRHTARSPSPRLRWYARIARRPASSPWEPALGWSDTAS